MEERGWALDLEELEKAYVKAAEVGLPAPPAYLHPASPTSAIISPFPQASNIKAIVIINPGNPTGQVV